MVESKQKGSDAGDAGATKDRGLGERLPVGQVSGQNPENGARGSVRLSDPRNALADVEKPLTQDELDLARDRLADGIVARQHRVGDVAVGVEFAAGEAHGVPPTITVLEAPAMWVRPV